MHDPQPFFAVEHGGADAQSFEIIDDVGFDTFKPGFCNLDVVRIDAEGQIFGLNQAVVASGQLILKHICIFFANMVKGVSLGRNGDALGKGFFGSGQIYEGELEFNGTVKVVQEITPSIEDGLLVIIMGQLIVDILELDGFGEMAFRDLTDSIRPHTQIGDTVLGGFFLLIRPVGSCDCGVYRFLFRSCQFFGGQSCRPPYQVDSAGR